MIPFCDLCENKSTEICNECTICLEKGAQIGSPFPTGFKERYKENKLIIRNDGLTEQEVKVMDNLVSAWNEYIKLEKQHHSDIDDFCDGIHKCQNALTMRVLRRDYPLGYPTYKE